MHNHDDSQPGSQALPPPRRVQRPQVPIRDAVIVADVSGSMDFRDGPVVSEFSPRRIDRLAKVLDYLLTRVRARMLICFNDVPIEVPLAGRVALPEPGGGTNLTLALDHVGCLVPKPQRVLVISDGIPDVDVTALQAARALRPMVIDAYYVGADDFGDAKKFMADLAAAGGPGGRSGNFDMLDPVLLGSELEQRLRLTGPRR